MISLSRIIKSTNYSPSGESIILSIKAPPPIKTEVSAERLQEIDENIQNAEDEAQIILRDAEETAQRIIVESAKQVELQQLQAQSEMDKWWEQKRLEADRLFQETAERAKQEGFMLGVEEGKAHVLQEEQQTIQGARNVLALAYEEKEKIIAEAEPFLVDLSMEVSKKVIGDELSSSPEKILEVVQRVLRRSRVHGQISLSVNHRYFEYIEEHRTQLLSLLDGQAELAILPDHTVYDEGCVIRTPLGSVDARIDTQLSEIKQALLEIARGSERNDIS